MNAKPLLTKLLQVFAWSRRVNHYYWIHTDADGPAGEISVENLQTIIARLARVRVSKRLVHFEGSTLRGNIERYDDHVVIHVRSSLSDYWRRFTVVKELCHVLLDSDGDFSTDVVSTISELLAFQSLDGDESAVLRSEKLAEIMALELIYPIEFRAEDRAFLDAGGKISALAEKRKVPPIWLERALAPWYIELCQEAWNALADFPADNEPLPPPANDN